MDLRRINPAFKSSALFQRKKVWSAYRARNKKMKNILSKSSNVSHPLLWHGEKTELRTNKKNATLQANRYIPCTGSQWGCRLVDGADGQIQNNRTRKASLRRRSRRGGRRVCDFLKPFPSHRPHFSPRRTTLGTAS